MRNGAEAGCTSHLYYSQPSCLLRAPNTMDGTADRCGDMERGYVGSAVEIQRECAPSGMMDTAERPGQAHARWRPGYSAVSGLHCSTGTAAPIAPPPAGASTAGSGRKRQTIQAITISEAVDSTALPAKPNPA